MPNLTYYRPYKNGLARHLLDLTLHMVIVQSRIVTQVINAKAVYSQDVVYF
jgi:hypothetical protein